MLPRVGYSPMNEEDDTLRVGKVLRVIGPVVDVEFFTEELPPTYNALQITVDERDLIIEIAQYLGDNVVRCIATASTDGQQHVVTRSTSWWVWRDGYRCQEWQRRNLRCSFWWKYGKSVC